MSEITNEVLAERLDNFKEEVKKELKALTEQVLKTNGSVTRLKEWRGYILGGLAVIVAVIIPLIYMVFSVWLNSK